MAKTYSAEIKQKARNLRSKGWSLGEIEQKMVIPKNTVSGWVRDVKLTKAQEKRIKEKIKDSGAIGRPLALKAWRKRMENWKNGIREKVKFFERFPRNNPEIRKFICGLLYLCEGAKYPASRFFYFANSDPKLIYFFITLLRETYNIEEGKLRFSIGYRYDQDYNGLKDYWSKLTGIPKAKCLKTKPDKRTKGKPTLKKGYMGICRLIYYDTSIQFELQSIGEAIIKGR